MWTRTAWKKLTPQLKCRGSTEYCSPHTKAKSGGEKGTLLFLSQHCPPGLHFCGNVPGLGLRHQFSYSLTHLALLCSGRSCLESMVPHCQPYFVCIHLLDFKKDTEESIEGVTSSLQVWHLKCRPLLLALSITVLQNSAKAIYAPPWLTEPASRLQGTDVLYTSDIKCCSAPFCQPSQMNLPQLRSRSQSLSALSSSEWQHKMSSWRLLAVAAVTSCLGAERCHLFHWRWLGWSLHSCQPEGLCAFVSHSCRHENSFELWPGFEGHLIFQRSRSAVCTLLMSTCIDPFRLFLHSLFRTTSSARVAHSLFHWGLIYCFL